MKYTLFDYVIFRLKIIQLLATKTNDFYNKNHSIAIKSHPVILNTMQDLH